jgi:hypothetical protein
MAEKYERLIEFETESMLSLCHPDDSTISKNGLQKSHWAVREAMEKWNARVVIRM